jgi:hypothetical protein
VEGGIYLYLLNYNSNVYLAGYKNDKFFKVDTLALTVALSHPNGIPMGTAPMNYYRGKY